MGAHAKSRRSRDISEDDIRRLVFPGFRFGKDDPAYAERLTDLGAGGFCVYGGGVQEIAALTRRLQRRARVPLLFCADYEDGLPTMAEGGTALPSNMGIGAAASETLAYRKGRITGIEARAIGVRWVFAPVVDLATRAENPIVNIRAFGAKPSLVSRLARAYLRGMRSTGVLSCVKHFPGHGDTRKDSHLELPTVAAGRPLLVSRDLAPYRATLPLADSVMLAHLHVPALGTPRGLPASLSGAVVGRLLRERMGYRGLVVTDALDMRAVAGRFPEAKAALMALEAGADVILVPARPESLLRALPGLVEDGGLEAKARAAAERLTRAKRLCGLFRDRGLTPAGDIERVESASHRRAAEKMAAAATAWARRGAGAVPLRGEVAYLEPRTGSSGGPQGSALLDELKTLGITAVPLGRARRADRVLVATFVGPRAYSGRIRLTPAERRKANAALGRSPRSVAASFGSPFVLDELRGFHAGLCAFSASEPAQRAAARVLAGKTRATGRMPV
ncbi:MAG: glycoside hydrolase family 3 N-terminal domain-containing protein [Elusimicrobiota bacterium]